MYEVHPATNLIAESCRTELAAIIADLGGREVFVIATVDENGIVTALDPIAFGNWDAVPAPAQNARAGQVLIHNHPGGDTEPSDADINVASLYGKAGIGFYIVDNDCRQVRVVVRPFKEKPTLPIDTDALAGRFQPGGDLAAALPGYEHRHEQVEMLSAVARALNEDRIAVVEAGTGTGKSFAYLAPSIIWATTNQRRVIVSTNTINLQEQLLQKDLPALRRTLDLKFKAVLLKGRGNYISIRRLRFATRTLDLFPDGRDQELRQIAEWASQTADGSLADLSFQPTPDAWEAVVSDKDDCQRARCPHFNECFYYRSRREAASADLVITNHHLVMADLALKATTSGDSDFAAILPPYDRIIFDEAHNLEEVATEYFSTEVSPIAIRRQLFKLHGRESRGLLPSLQRAVFDADGAAVHRPTTPLLDAIAGPISQRHSLLETHTDALFSELAERVMEHFGIEHLPRNERRELRITDAVLATPLWPACEETVSQMADELEGLAKEIEKALSLIRSYPESILKDLIDLRTSIAGVATRLAELAAAARFFLKAGESHCRWFELSQPRGRLTLRLDAAPLDVAPALRSALFARKKSVVLTSATLTVDSSFDFLSRRLGISDPDGADTAAGPVTGRTDSLLLHSPFDFARNCLIGIPRDIAAPDTPGFESSVEDLLIRTLTLSGGCAFVLFTSYRSLERMYAALQAPLSAKGMTLMRQGDMPRSRLLEAFKSARRAVLFATASFWEGVDVQGSALACLVLVRLPFRVPSTPILEARTEAIQVTGGDPFRELSLPLAVIRFKQGFGRLIRSKTDRGIVLILDNRVVTKPYGKTFMRSLPPAAVVDGPASKVLDEFERFLTR